jgi:DNA polymerase V
MGDPAFKIRDLINLGEFREREVEPLARELRERVLRWVCIPTCVGIAPTKTLAKVAKRRPQYRGVCDLRSASVRAELLPTVPVDEVWGNRGRGDWHAKRYFARKMEEKI